MVYQARQTLKNQYGNNWQAIAFKHIRNDGKTSFFLRLVGFPQVAEIDCSQPLTLSDSLGKILTATYSSNDIFTDSFYLFHHLLSKNGKPLGVMNKSNGK